MSKRDFFKHIFIIFSKRKFSIFLFFFLGFFSLVFGLIEPYFTAQLMQAITSISLDSILLFSGILLGIGVLEQFFGYFQSEQSVSLMNAITLDAQAFVSEELFSLEQKNFDQKGSQFFTSRIMGDAGVVSSILSRLNYSLTYTLKSFGVLIYIFIMSIPMGIYITVSSCLLFLFRFKGIKVRERQRKERDEKGEVYMSSFSELIRGIRDIKVLNLKDKVIHKTLTDQKKLNKLEQSNRRKMFMYDEIRYFLEGFIQFGIWILAIYLLSKDLFVGANLIVLYTYKNQAFQFFNSVFGLVDNLMDTKYSFGRLYEIMDGKTYSKEKFGRIHKEKLEGDIVFQNVSFGYEDTKVLQNVSFHIKPNDTVGFVGKSGAGKSTIFSLIPKLYTPQKGDILMDGVSITDLDEATIRENISVITQNPYLFNLTIRENLKIVNPSATEEEMIHNCKLCAFHDYVMSLPKGYDTLIGEGGVILSGGLRQRLAIARALMKKSEIILLDEATSSLDNETQDFIKNSIHQISKNYTILIIAHRLSTVKDCDYIFVIDEGRVVGIGKHSELIKNNAYYKNLYQHELL